MSQISTGLYVGSILQSDIVYIEENDKETVCGNEGSYYYDLDYSIKGVITVCRDLPCWCNLDRIESPNSVTEEYQNVLKKLQDSDYDHSYIDLHLDLIKIPKTNNVKYILHSVITADDSITEPLFKAFEYTFKFVKSIPSLFWGNRNCNYLY